MTVDRLLPTEEAEDLLGLVRQLTREQLTPYASDAEERHEFPREAFRLLGRTGLLSLPYPQPYGGGDQPYEVYLQALEELAAGWMTVGLGVSVHGLSCFPLATYGTEQQQQAWLPGMLGGGQLGAYCLSEPEAGSDIASMTTRAVRGTDGGWRLHGTKAWISHGGIADFYTVFARTSDDRKHGVSCFLVDAGTPGMSFGKPEHKMGFNASPTTLVEFDGVRLEPERLIGAEGAGLRIALSALDCGRLGIAAGAVGLAQAALDLATSYAKERRQFGQPIAEFQGLAFLLAEMAAAVTAARATYLDAARRKDRGRPFGTEAAVAKLTATDAAMRVTTDAVQVLGGYGYTRDYPAERYMREAKVLQIFEGTNQIQRLVVSRSL